MDPGSTGEVKQREKVEEKKRGGGKKPRGHRLSARGQFVLQELYKVRRLSANELARLICAEQSRFAAVRLATRMEKLGFIRRDVEHVRSKPYVLYSLTEAGRAQAAAALSRDYQAFTYDDLDAKYLDHLMMGTELYLRMAAEGCHDWTEVRERASAFRWFSSNEQTQFVWDELDANRERVTRKLVPDITIETDTARYLIEIERSTKTLRVVDNKVERYTRLFSPLRTMGGGTPYAQKYVDEKKVVLVFVFESDARANEIARRIEKRALQRFFSIPTWKSGTLATLSDWMRGQVLTTPPVRHEDIAAVYMNHADALVKFISEATLAFRDLRMAEQRGEKLTVPPEPAALPQILEFMRALKRVHRGKPGRLPL